MRNFVQEGDRLTFTAPVGGVVSGTGYMIGGLLAVATSTGSAGLPFEAQTVGVIEMPKAAAGSGKAFTEGERVWWDDTNKRWDKTGSGLFQCGVAVAAAASTATTVLVAINRPGVAAT